MSASEHVKRFPNARSSTVVFLMKREEKVQQLRREIRESERRRKTFLDWLWSDILRGDRWRA